MTLFCSEIMAHELEKLGALIGEARAATGLTQEALAEKLKTSRSNVIRLEKGRSVPTTTTLQKIAAATGHRLEIVFRLP